MSRSPDASTPVDSVSALHLTDDFPPVPDEAWREKIRKDLRGADPDTLIWNSIEGVDLHPYYRKEDLDDLKHVDLSGDTGPVTRRSGNAWRIRQDLTGSDPAAIADAARMAVDRGATDLGLLLPGHDAAHRTAPVHTADDLRTALDGIDLSDVAVHLSRGASAAALFPSLADAEPDGLSLVGGSVEYDPVAALATGDVYDTGDAFELAAGLADYAADGATDEPVTHLLAVDARPYHDAGASAVQELAFSLSALAETMDRLTEAGYDAATLATVLQFVVPVDTSYFIEIAKLRALRLTAAQVLNPILNAADTGASVDPADVFIQATTSQRTHTAYGPYVNMLRGTTEAAAAVIGGCNVLSVAPYDVTSAERSDFSDRIARNTQLILQHEAHLDEVADPAAGSYYVENVTDALAREAWSLFQDIEAGGGIVEALQDGHVAERIASVRDERTDRVATRSRVLVGTNHYPDLTESASDALAEPDASEESGSETDSSDAGSRPGDPALLLGTPLLASVASAMAEGATLNSVLSALRGGSPDVDPLPAVRLSEPFEALRGRTDAYAERTGRRPTVVLAPMGPPSARSARATFARNFFGVAGFRIVETLAFETPEEAAEAAVDDGADLVVACSSDGTYPSLIPDLSAALDDAGSRALLFVAGNPNEIDGDLGASGTADGFVHLGSPLLDTLRSVQDRLGIDA